MKWVKEDKRIHHYHLFTFVSRGIVNRILTPSWPAKINLRLTVEDISLSLTRFLVSVRYHRWNDLISHQTTDKTQNKQRSKQGTERTRDKLSDWLTKSRLNEWITGWMDGWMNRRISSLVFPLIIKQANCTNQLTNGWMNEWTNQWMKKGRDDNMN